MPLGDARDSFLNLKCEHCPVHNHAICRVLNQKDLHKISDIMVHRHYKAGHLLWIEGEEISDHAIIVSGVVKLFKLLPDGRQQIIGLLFPSDFLGRAFSQTEHNFAETATDVDLCCLPREKFERLLKTHKDLEHELFIKTLKDLDDARNWLLALGRKSAMEKVASFLLEFSKKVEHTHCPHIQSISDNPTFLLPLSRSEIADYLGLTIETVSRCFTKLKAQSIIRLQEGHIIEICRPDQLRFMTGDDFDSN